MAADDLAARLTEAQLVCLAAYMQSGNTKATADHLGIALSTVKNHLCSAYARLGVGSAVEAATVLGWVTVPTAYAMCGWLGTCTRKADHRGQHGGFRGQPRVEGPHPRAAGRHVVEEPEHNR